MAYQTTWGGFFVARPNLPVARKRLFHPAPMFRLEGEMVDQQFYLPNNAVLVVAPVAEDMAGGARSCIAMNIAAMCDAWRAARQPVLDHAADGRLDTADLKARLRREGLNCLVLAGGFTKSSLNAALEKFGKSGFEAYVVNDAICGVEHFAPASGCLTVEEAIGALAPDHEPSRAAGVF